MLLAMLLVSLGSQLVQADISIELADRTATVEAHYRLDGSEPTFEASLIVIPDQSLDRLDANRAPTSRLSWEERAGLIRIRVPAAPDRPLSVTLRYRVRGRLERIPIPVPTRAAQPGRGSVRLSVRGLEPNLRFLDGFPRLVPEDGGVARARLDNVPSFLRTPPHATTWSVSRLAQLLVMVLIVGSSAAWSIRVHRSRSAPR